VVNQLGTTAYRYDSRGRTLRVDHPDATYIAYTYDEAGNRTKADIPSSITTYSFDELNRLATVTDPDGGITTYGYDAIGNRASVLLPNQVLTRYSYDELNRLTLLENLAPDTSIISSYAYTLGKAGNRLAVLENSGRRVQYTYDPLYRLTAEDIFGTDLSITNIVYQYDKVGNRLSKMVNGEETLYSYDENDRLLSEGGNTYQYDANGNTIAKLEPQTVIIDSYGSTGAGNIIAKTTYTYDGQNRLIRVENPTNTAEYEYNHENIRISKTHNGVQTRYLIDANQAYQQVLEEYENNQLTALYIYGDDLISQDRGNTSYYLYDGQMSTRQLVNPSATITDRYDYDAFGVSIFEEGFTENNYRYTGEQFDRAAQAYYLRARYYDQASGRFWGMDPYSGHMHEPMTLHRYLYARTNPVMNIDPSGEVAIGGVNELSMVQVMMHTIRASRLPSFTAVTRTAFKATLALGAAILVRHIYNEIPPEAFLYANPISIYKEFINANDKKFQNPNHKSEHTMKLWGPSGPHNLGFKKTAKKEKYLFKVKIGYVSVKVVSVMGGKTGRAFQLEHWIGGQNHRIFGLHYEGWDVMRQLNLSAPPFHLHYHRWPNFNSHITIYPKDFSRFDN